MLYLDASAIVKLVKSERETEALGEFIRSHPDAISSALAEVEVARAVWRLRDPSGGAQRAAAVFERIALVPMNREVLAEAARVEVPSLRALDAIHLATALLHREDIDGLVTYDRRLASAARSSGITVVAPA
jgi:predicted nucleic acid-binding protein